MLGESGEVDRQVEELFAKFPNTLSFRTALAMRNLFFACRADNAGGRLLPKHIVIPNRFSDEESALGVEKADSSDLRVFGMTYSFKT